VKSIRKNGGSSGSKGKTAIKGRGPTRRARGQGRALPSLPGILGLWRVRPGAFFCQIPPLPVTLVRWARSAMNSNTKEL